ncbi:uncharacterized protein BDZ83DRAFT_331140 [Colletotrichum acutatum]|uniref:Uncharacterized protein n=1 Tax=Glomerella acutata TaxID=27357 RepID=A0AAD8XNF0_GLOAC|nr:uncharacterized protein BDZ83DRAFT_331140 [Colletotrichum acutatum]KAK1730682.1 hypothetical protein BDZ83DRAFT_331140 [Colletotrichum acutatum]
MVQVRTRLSGQVAPVSAPISSGRQPRRLQIPKRVRMELWLTAHFTCMREGRKNNGSKAIFEVFRHGCLSTSVHLTPSPSWDTISVHGHCHAARRSMTTEARRSTSTSFPPWRSLTPSLGCRAAIPGRVSGEYWNPKPQEHGNSLGTSSLPFLGTGALRSRYTTLILRRRPKTKFHTIFGVPFSSSEVQGAPGGRGTRCAVAIGGSRWATESGLGALGEHWRGLLGLTFGVLFAGREWDC